MAREIETDRDPFTDEKRYTVVDGNLILGAFYDYKEALLHCAAPDLLEALEKLAVTYADYRSKTDPDFDPMLNSRCLAEARAAIAKARS